MFVDMLQDKCNQSASKHERRTFLYSAMRELVCNGQLWAKEALRQLGSITSNSESILQQQFGENPGNDCCYSIYFDISTIVWLSRSLQQVSNDVTLGFLVYYSAKMSRHRQNGLSFVLKKILT